MSEVEVKALELAEDVVGLLELEEFYAGLLQSLQRIIPSDWVSLNDLGPAPEDVTVLVRPEVPAKLIPAFLRLREQNPLIAHYAETRDARAYRFSDFVSTEELHELDIYREFYAPLRVEHQMAFTLPASEHRIMGVALSRESPDYSDLERDVVNRARPVLIQAFRNAVAYQDPLRLRGAMSTGLLQRLRREGLSTRQAEVIALLVAGLRAREIAERLSISPRTVSKHTELGYRLLGVNNQADAVRRAVELLQPASGNGQTTTG